jgi:hypothetical protein
MGPLSPEFPRGLKVLIEKTDLSLHGKIKRSFTGESYVLGHTIPVGEEVEKLVRKNFKKGGYVIGRGHDILETLSGESKNSERKDFLNQIENYGYWGSVVSQGLQLLDFKTFMPKFLEEKGINLKKETKTKGARNRIKQQNYPILMRSLYGEFGIDFFEQTHDIAHFYAILTKIVDLKKNLDMNLDFKSNLTENQKYYAKRHIIRNSIRIWEHYERGLETLLFMGGTTYLESEKELKNYMRSALIYSSQKVREIGNSSDVSKLILLERNLMLEYKFN